MTADTPTFVQHVDTFGAGWSAGDEGRIVSVFSADATFFPDPFSHPIRGVEAIRAYWRHTPREQANVNFVSGQIFVAGPWFATEFRCTFRRRRTGEWMDVKGSLFCETSEGLISEMRMYWHRQAGTPPA